MNQDALKNYIRKLVKEAIVEQSTSVVSETKEPKKVLVVKESKQPLANEQYIKILEGRKALIESMISEKGLMDKLGGMFGKVNPSLDVDDPSKAGKVVGGSIAKAQKLAKDFQSKALNTTSTINAFHDAVIDALDKWASLSDSVPEQKAAMEKQVMDVARQFFQSLNNEKGRIDSFLKTITNDLAAKGFDKSMMTVNPKAKPTSVASPSLRNKEDVPPMNSIGKGIKDMATNWAK